MTSERAILVGFGGLAVMEITLEQLRRVAWLARLPMDDDALLDQQRHCQRLLDFVADLQSAPIAAVAPLSNPLLGTQPLRPDRVTEQDQHLAFQKLAPETEADLYRVPRVVE